MKFLATPLKGREGKEEGRVNIGKGKARKGGKLTK